MNINLIVTVNDRGLKVPSNYLDWIREITKGQPVIMDEKTFRAVGLQLRSFNIVLNDSFNSNISCIQVKTVDAAFDLLKSYKEIFILGEPNLYDRFYIYAMYIYYTEIYDKEVNATQDMKVGSISLETGWVKKTKNISPTYDSYYLERE